MDKYIPIIVILVSIVFSIIGKAKKQGNVTQETTLPGKKPGKFIDEIELPRTISSSTQKVFEEKTKKPALKKPEMINRKEIKPLFTSEIAVIESEENENSSFSFENEDDVKRAIIYSEIINKKEW